MSPFSAPIRTAPRVTTLGEFEIHVQRARAARYVQPPLEDVPTPAPRTAALPPYSQGPDVLPQYSNPKEFSDDKQSVRSMTLDEMPKLSNRTTSDDEEPKTLSRALFLYGFLMPLLWLIGASIIFLDLKYYPDALHDVEDPRTEEERAADLEVIRRAELRWAWRSLYAFVTVTLFTVIILVTYLGVTKKWTGVHS
ncbi:hypothetical protein BS47DRAFT_1393079 [Hydnum rufescens UP504]|uniref:Transmembrane protein n=1 Tax=Hydnum rufescens UP504 TaxID=1448309 RepID=A0A9P6DXA6_9AGAM|nr:hypothetical protein BS47DRAFT_1393079 [Hydnum rufescens UP504]